MNINKRFASVIAAFLVAAGIVAGSTLPAFAADPQGVAATVLCPDGNGSCTQYRYGFYIPNSSGQFGIYYTVRWSTSGGSFKVVQVRWVNNSNSRIYFDSFGVAYGATYFPLATGSGSWSIASGTSMTLSEFSFNGSAKGKYFPKGGGSVACSDPNFAPYQYQTSSQVGTPARFRLS